MNTHPVATQTDTAIEIKGVNKLYPGVQALTNISLEFKWGNIYGLAGENGSGKSTLLELINGLEAPSSGLVKINGKQIHSVKDALDAKVAMVTQEPSLAESLTVMENIAFGQGRKMKLLVDWEMTKQRAVECLQELDSNIDPHLEVRHLSADQQQLVSICRALITDPDILLLDEATSSLTNDQVDTLFNLLRKFKDSGKIIIFITHKLKEYLELCDEITVLRDSHFITSLSSDEMNEDNIIKAMVGREVSDLFPDKHSTVKDDHIIEVEKLHAENIKDITFSVKKGEIFVLSGLVGCGRTEVLRSIAGLLPYEGQVKLDGKEVQLSTPRVAVDRGISFIPAERKFEGIVGGLSVSENAVLSQRLKRSLVSWLNFKEENRRVEQLVKEFTIKTASLKTKIETLSGGNQQKVILARAISTHPNVLLLDEPTRGIDVGAKAEIYHLLRRISAEGVTVIISSSDLQEVIGVADRVGVMFRGTLMKVLEGDSINEEEIMYCATGNM